MENLPMTICENTLRRTVRVGACPVLTVTAVYPVLCGEGEAVTRFNQTYEQAAKAFVAWGLNTLETPTREAFDMARVGGAQTFARRELLCKMTASFRHMETSDEESSDASDRHKHISHQAPRGEDASGTESWMICVRMASSYGLRRRKNEEKTCSSQHIWQFPQGYFLPEGQNEKGKRRGRKHSLREA